MHLDFPDHNSDLVCNNDCDNDRNDDADRHSSVHGLDHPDHNANDLAG